ncbi:MAG TPA: hypothetical protein VH054_24050 [Polyangiaceae bacterium]|jgi:hypothetical protein|nr:hypothetical protein [Polyangiaceae bacterium]
MDTLPRFRFPDESSSHDVSKAAKAARSGAWSDFDDLDSIETRVLVKKERGNDFMEAMPTKVRPRKFAGKTNANANVDDVVEELRAAAAGRSSKVRELNSQDLLDELDSHGADDAQEVDVSELVFDKVVRPREVWNVHQAARPTQTTILGPKQAQSRFIVTAALAMLFGALLAVAVAFVIWRLTGLNFS